VLAHLVHENERITFHKVFVHLTAFIGALLTIIPSLAIESTNVSFRLIGFVFLFTGLFFYGLGSIYIKLYMTKGETSLVCVFSVLGGTTYNLIALLVSGGFGVFSEIPSAPLAKIFVFAMFFSALPSFLFIYVVRELGPVTANLVDFGQIIIGVTCGVCILDEWKTLKRLERLISWIGVVQIFLTLAFDFESKWEAPTVASDPLPEDQAQLLDEENMIIE
jgi:drug/metabolite transporter (DMT)-like permease